MIENPLTEYIRDHAGETVYFPKCLKKQERDAAIISEFDRLIVGHGAQEAIDIITRTHYVSASTVRRVLKRRRT